MDSDRLDALDLEPEEESPYLRRQKRVEVRRTGLNRGPLRRLKKLAPALLVLAALAAGLYSVVQFGLHDSRFLLRPERLEVRGARYVARSQILEKFSGDSGRSVWAVPLERRRAMLEQVAWVERAEVARLWPDRIRVVICERTPVAFARTSAGLLLVDRHGVLFERPPQAVFSFPVITGLTESDSSDDRRRMVLYNSLIEDLDREGMHYSLEISEVDLSDPEDARVIISGPGGAILVHLGNSKFLERYKIFLAHIQEWRRDFPNMSSVDLRYDRQIVVNPQ